MKYFKAGIALLLPLGLTAFVLNWLYGLGKSLILLVVPEWDQWWLPIAAVAAVAITIWLIGLVFSFASPLRWVYKKLEHWIIMQIPFVKQLYGFGIEISDAFLADIKEDEDLTVVAVKDQFGGEAIGVITDKQNNIIFIPTAPNPTNGFLTVNPHNVRVVNTMGYADAIKLVTSIGKINGEKVNYQGDSTDC